MGAFDTMVLFDKNKNIKYSPELLFDAYKSIVLTDGYGEYEFSDGDHFYIDCKSQKENIDHINHMMKDLFHDIYLIDSFVHNNSDEFEIAGFDFHDLSYSNGFADKRNENMINIEYYGIKYNTQFDIEIYKEKNKWYCTGMGDRKLANPVCINDFPNGFSFSGLKQERILSNPRRIWYKVLN